MKNEGSAGEVGPFGNTEALSGEAHAEDFSDDEPENELEALQHLPPEDRRKALRRLRNRESARRVRARRLAEMSQMESSMRGIKDENSVLKAHVSKLQNHIQSMTLKVYEVTSKYESAVAENAQLRAELQRLRRPSAPGESSLAASMPAAAGMAAAAGPNSAPPQISPFVAPGDDADPAHLLSVGHAALRSSSPVDLQHQRQALEEVVMLLKEHKRRSQMTTQDRSAGSEIGSSAVMNNAAASSFNNAHSPVSDTGVPCVLPMFGGGKCLASEAGPGAMNNGSLSYNGCGAGAMLGPSPVLGPSCASLGSVGRGTQEAGLGRMTPQPQQLLGAQQHHMLGSYMPTGNSTGLCQLTLSNSSNGAQQLPSLSQVQQIQQQLLAKQSASTASGGVSGLAGVAGCQAHQQHQHQTVSCVMQSQSTPLPQLHLSQCQPHQFGAQQPLLMPGGLQQGPGGSVPYNSVSALSAPFITAAPFLPGSSSVTGPAMQGNLTGPTGVLASGGMGAPGCGLGPLGNQYRSASFGGVERGTGMAFGSGGFVVNGAWHAGGLNPVAGQAGVGCLRPEDIPEDVFMSLEDYVPQDL